MFSTAVCIKMGYVYQNYMVNMVVSNSKLMRRAVSMVCEITGLESGASEKLLQQNDWSVRAALWAYFQKHSTDQ